MRDDSHRILCAAPAAGAARVQPTLRCLDEWLPEFEAVALGIGDPGEMAVGEGLLVGVDGNIGGAELAEETLKVVDAVVDSWRAG